ncbi:SH3 domain-containing protein [Rhodovulum sulfidophilum]|uniref:SH3 domain-containing protein n=1 Tax=Rhodovulum sulfidophilum TaxID=35806 RepID=UPI001923BF91|nr:SH3 domain-containing protein [Rhodovulum sulfidophilum]MBL3561979.1 SH3 domain-containing protein [Rhodovulum sulfidophilum]
MTITGCAIGSGAVVKGVGTDDLLKLRDGPGLDHNIIIGLPDGTRLTRQSCLTANNGTVWCKVFLTDKPRVSGYVSAGYLAQR